MEAKAGEVDAERAKEIFRTKPKIRDEIAEQRSLVEQKKLRYSFAFSQYYHEWFNGQLLGLLDPKPEFSVLDCGCGTGVMLPTLGRRYRQTVGLDLSIDNLRVAHNGDCRALVVGDIGELPLARGSFDHIICRGVLHLLPDVGRGLRELFDIVKDGGDLVISEPIKDSPLLSILRVTFRRRSAEALSSDEWIRTAEIAGFRAVQWLPVGYLAFPLIGFPEASYVMRYAPFPMTTARLLLSFDRTMARVPYLRRWSWQAMFHFKKP